jgi:WD40 repeat protein/tRNA A-37 threonylcarbamoyl transferase component Bud32
MRHESTTASPDAADAGAAERLAAIDDCLGGMPPGEAAAMPDDRSLADPALADALDAILLLRQTAAADARSPEPPAALPRTVGRFQIVREAGRGGFAYVAEAIDPMLHRSVALKIARPESLLSHDVRRRFIREAEIAARLIHPHIVGIHEVGEAGGLVFIAQEYCAGGSLADWLERHPGPLEPRTAVRLVRALAQAVAHAHSHGIVHRDIKPANVLLVPVDAASGDMALLQADGFTIKLGDFGLGKTFVADDAGDDPLTQLTQSGMRLGTPAWMAPEQIDASFGPVGPATDIHGLGVLLDRLLTGRNLRAGRTDAETFRKVLLDDPPPADRIAAGVPRDLGAVCLKCMAKRPSDRYHSAAELAADLTRYLDGRPTIARPLSPIGRLAMGVTRRPLVALLSAAVFAATLLAGWSMRERSLEATKQAAYRDDIRRHEATAELRRGFDAWRTGNAAGADGHLRACAKIDRQLADSVAGRWLDRRIHGEESIVLETEPRPDGSRPGIHAIALAPDGRSIAAGSTDGRLLITSLASSPQKPPLTVAAHDEINAVCFSPDSTRIATVGQDGRMRLWAADGRSLGGATPVGAPLYGVSFTASGDAVLFGGEDRIVRTIPTTDDGHDDIPARVFHACQTDVRPDADIESICRVGDTMIAVACGESVMLLDAKDGRLLRSIDAVKSTMTRAAVSPDASLILCAGHDGSPGLWNPTDGRLVRRLLEHPDWVLSCGFSADGRQAVTASKDGVARVFDIADGSLRQRLVGHLGRVWDAAFDSTGFVITAGADGTVRRWDPRGSAGATGLTTLEPDGGVVRAILSLPCDQGGNSLIAMQAGRSPLLITSDGSSRRIPLTDHDAGEAVFDAPRRRLAVEHRRSPLKVFVLASEGAWREVSLPASDTAVVTGLAWTPEGTLVAGCADGRLLAWNPELTAMTELHRFEKPVYTVSICGVGDGIIAAGSGKEVAVFSLPQARPAAAAPAARKLFSLESLPGDVQATAWSPDGTRLACATNGGFVVFFDAVTGDRTGSLAAHERDLLWLAYSPDGRTLLSADSMSLRFSDALTLALFDELRPGWQINAVNASADGRAIVLGGGTIPAPDSAAPREGRVGIVDLGPPKLDESP